MLTTTKKITLTEFLNLPTGKGDITYELIEGEIITKMSPKRFHSRLTGAIFTILSQWGQDMGEIGIEWAITLQKNDQDWCPVPDLLYISNQRLATENVENTPCLIPPELVIEIISPDQRFGDLSQKAIDYLQGGVDRVWIVDPEAKSITIFYPDSPPKIKRGEQSLKDDILPGLQFTVKQIFQQAKLW